MTTANLLKFSNIEKGDIFCKEFSKFSINNTIDFSSKDIAVLYGPNGTGKTSLAKVLDSNNGTKFEASYKDISSDKLFHVINDQNGRNIIQGSPKEFFIGDSIAREYDLKELINSEFDNLFKNLLLANLKNLNISTKTSKLIDLVQNQVLQNFVKSLANKSLRGKDLDTDSFLVTVSSLSAIDIQDYDEEKFSFFLNDYDSSDSVIRKLMDISSIDQHENIIEIEENDYALKILNKFCHKDNCIVCDNQDYHSNILLKKKSNNKKAILDSLSSEIREILDKVFKSLSDNDPFKIKDSLLDAIKQGDIQSINSLISDIKIYFTIFDFKINNLFFDSLSDTNLIDNNSEYLTIISNKPEMDDDDILYITKIVNENIGKNITLQRDEHNNLKLLIGGVSLLNVDRKEMSLSNGEQNFVSLSFELLKAKKSDKEIIVLDDPISSFDSIYKNKIAFSIIKVLENKKQIILTHNTELVRLLHFQKQNCFDLYFFNNIENGENGFIPVNKDEQEILLNLNLLLDLFRENIVDEIIDEKLFLVSIIPFMRGFANILGNSHKYKLLSKVMHGYENNKIDLSNIYKDLFNKKKPIETKYIISVNDILNIDLENLNILCEDTYPLLNKTLKHTLTYLSLRLRVEKTIVDKYDLGLDYNNPRNPILLSTLIYKAFRNDQDKRIFFTSRKTLLNEFNHFEGNMNIFQPAIDISDKALEKEVKDILEKLTRL